MLGRQQGVALLFILLLGHWTSSAFFTVTFLEDFLVVVPFLFVCGFIITCSATSSRLIADYSVLLFIMRRDESGD